MPIISLLNATESPSFVSPFANASFFLGFPPTPKSLAITKTHKRAEALTYLPMKDWKVAKAKKKADHTAVELFTQIANSGGEESDTLRKNFQQKQHYFFAELDNDTCDKWILSWPILEDKPQQITKFGLINLALEAYLDLYPLADICTAYNYGISLYEDDTPLRLVSILEELRLYKLQNNLSWINLNHLEPFTKEPLLLFKFILSHNNHPFPKQDFWDNPSKLDNNLFPEENLRSFDETALLWNQLQTGKRLNEVANEFNGIFIISELRNLFKKAFIPSFQKQKIVDQLFSETANNSSEIYFDGFALRNAQNYTFAELTQRPELSKIVGYEVLTANEKQAYLQEAFNQRGESTQYPIGSLSHSLASCLIRIFQYQHHRLPPLFSDEQQLITFFKQAEEEWLEKKNYPINLRILVAIHLARSNNIDIEGNDWQEKVKFVLNYLAREFKYILAPARIDQLKFSFDPIKAAWQVLTAYGMSDEEIYAPRPPYQLIIPNGEKKRRGDALTDIVEVPLRSDNALDEFLKKAKIDKVPPMTNGMIIKGKRIEPRAELDKKREEYDNQLMTDPWIEEKAKISLMAQKIAITPASLAREKKRLIVDYKKAVDNPQQWTKTTNAWLYYVPILGPLETIHDGIKEKEILTVLLGVAFLSLDAWSLGLSRLMRSFPLAISRLSAREQITANSLSCSLRLFDISSADIARTEPIINRAPFSFEASPELLEAAKQGVPQLWRDAQGKDYLLAYLEDEKRIVAVKNQGGYYREIDWETGKVNLKKSLIYKNKDTGRYTVSSLKGGSPGRYDFFIDLIPEAELKERPTIKETVMALAKAQDYRNHPNFREKFRLNFIVSEVPASVQDFKIEELNKDFLDVEEISQQVYLNSPTFRRLFNRFIALSGHKPTPWSIEIKIGQKCRTDLVNKVIYLDPNIESSEARYLSANSVSQNYSGEVFKRQASVIHELVHAFTNLDDLESLAQAKLLSQAHRGGTVFLTDRILFEAYEPLPERLVYRAFSEENSVNKEILISRLVQENHYLDKLLNDEVPIEEYRLIAGKPSDSRYTIQEMEKITPLFTQDLQSRNFIDFPSRFIEVFTGEDEELLDEMINFLSPIYEESKTFKQLFDRYSGLKELTEAVEIVEFKRNFAEIVFSSKPGAVRIIEDDMWYLSAMGPLPIERRRRFLQGVLAVLTGLSSETIAVEKQLLHRSSLVQLVDRVFREAKMEIYFPKRLIAASFLPEENLSQLLNNWSTLSRIADLEDRFIEKKIFTKTPSCSLFSCIFPSKSKRQEDIKKLIAEIKKSNEQAGITLKA